MATVIPMLKLTPLSCPVRTPWPTAAPWIARATSSDAMLSAMRNTPSPTTSATSATMSTGLRPTTSEILPDTRTAPSAATA
jgi:hypothetical protein